MQFTTSEEEEGSSKLDDAQKLQNKQIAEETAKQDQEAFEQEQKQAIE